MHEFGTGVVTYTATAQSKGGIAQSKRVDAGNADIDSVSLHVKAVFRYARGAGAEEFIAPR